MKNNNYIFSKNLINEYIKIGVKYAFVSPGSRNTPLLLALCDQKKIKVLSIIDERVSGFMALGAAKSLKFPVLVVTTSGSAVANLFPSIVESFMSSVPIIYITADRPKKLINTGSNQTIYQEKIFGKYVLNFFDVSIENHIKNTQSIKLAKESLSISLNKKGPVHINIHFDKPLYVKNRLNLIHNKPTDNFIPKTEKNNITSSFPNFSIFKKPLIVCTDDKDIIIIKKLEKYKIPIFMECIGSRFTLKSKNIISNYEFILKNKSINPDLIIRFGKKPISNALNNFLKENRNKIYLVSEKIFNDDSKNIINLSNEQFFNEFCKQKFNFDIKWFSEISIYQNIIEKKILKYFSDPIEHEGYILNRIISKIPDSSNIFIGNSSPIRDLDQFTFNISKKFNIYSNRGASGIDGLISSSIGIALTSNDNNFTIIGDMSFYYDVSSLINNSLVKNLTIIVINNMGGHIFDRLEGISTESQYIKYWLNPINYKIRDIAKSFNCDYIKLKYNNLNDLDFLNESFKGIRIVEVIIESKNHHLENDKICKGIKEELI